VRLRLSREAEEPFASNEFKRLTGRDLVRFPFGARVSAIGNELASVVSPFARQRQGDIWVRPDRVQAPGTFPGTRYFSPNWESLLNQRTTVVIVGSRKPAKQATWDTDSERVWRLADVPGRAVWRLGSESNRRRRLCRPLHDHSAT
jgi:hypothetical protein